MPYLKVPIKEESNHEVNKLWEYQFVVIPVKGIDADEVLEDLCKNINESEKILLRHPSDVTNHPDLLTFFSSQRVEARHEESQTESTHSHHVDVQTILYTEDVEVQTEGRRAKDTTTQTPQCATIPPYYNPLAIGEELNSLLGKRKVLDLNEEVAKKPKEEPIESIESMSEEGGKTGQSGLDGLSGEEKEDMMYEKTGDDDVQISGDPLLIRPFEFPKTEEWENFVITPTHEEHIDNYQSNLDTVVGEEGVDHSDELIPTGNEEPMETDEGEEGIVVSQTEKSDSLFNGYMSPRDKDLVPPPQGGHTDGVESEGEESDNLSVLDASTVACYDGCLPEKTVLPNSMRGQRGIKREVEDDADQEASEVPREGEENEEEEEGEEEEEKGEKEQEEGEEEEEEEEREEEGEEPAAELCTKCGKSVSTEKTSMKSHMKSHAVTHLSFSPYECTRCTFAHRNKYIANRHVKECKGRLRVNALKEAALDLLALECFPLNYKLTRHGLKDADVVDCEGCGLSIYEKRKAHHILIEHLKEIIWTCAYCEDIFVDETRRDDHITTDHPGDVAMGMRTGAMRVDIERADKVIECYFPNE